MRRMIEKKKKDLWSIVYGELTEDGEQYIAKETGKPRINKGAGYDPLSQIGVDDDYHIIVRVQATDELKPAIAVAEKHADEGVTYKIGFNQYYKNPVQMTIDVPLDDLIDENKKQERKASMKLTEAAWKYNVPKSLARRLRDMINDDDPHYEEIMDMIAEIYEDIKDNFKELDDWDKEDLEETIEEIRDWDPDFVDDAEGDVNYYLGDLYDYCDGYRIWIPID